MTEFTDWLQNNAIDVARLAMECVILVTVVRFSRTLLRTLRASQEQLGALLRLSVSDGASQQANSVSGSFSGSVSGPFSEPSMREPEAEPVFTSERVFAPVAPAPAYNSSSILGAINVSERGGSDRGHGGFSERDHSLGGRVAGERSPMEEADTAGPRAQPSPRPRPRGRPGRSGGRTRNRCAS